MSYWLQIGTMISWHLNEEPLLWRLRWYGLTCCEIPVIWWHNALWTNGGLILSTVHIKSLGTSFIQKKLHSIILKKKLKYSFETSVKIIVKWRSQVTLYLTIITRLKFMSLFLCPLSKLDPTLSISSANKL